MKLSQIAAAAITFLAGSEMLMRLSSAACR